MRHVIVYDIGSTAVRNRISGCLEGYGQRVQRSVFECDLEGTEIDELIDRLKRLLCPGTEDSIRIYQMCNRCWSMALGIGIIDKYDDDDPCIILD